MNIRFLWEFEEEIGSPNFEKIISKAARDLRTDSVVVSDTVWVSATATGKLGRLARPGRLSFDPGNRNHRHAFGRSGRCRA